MNQSLFSAPPSGFSSLASTIFCNACQSEFIFHCGEPRQHLVIFFVVVFHLDGDNQQARFVRDIVFYAYVQPFARRTLRRMTEIRQLFIRLPARFPVGFHCDFHFLRRIQQRLL
jgi:hypothetical protein